MLEALAGLDAETSQVIGQVIALYREFPAWAVWLPHGGRRWAAGHHAPHFAGVPGADRRYHALLREFREETGPLTGAALAAACRRAPGHEGAVAAGGLDEFPD